MFFEREQKFGIKLSGKGHGTFLNAMIFFEVNRLQICRAIGVHLTKKLIVH